MSVKNNCRLESTDSYRIDPYSIFFARSSREVGEREANLLYTHHKQTFFIVLQCLISERAISVRVSVKFKHWSATKHRWGDSAYWIHNEESFTNRRFCRGAFLSVNPSTLILFLTCFFYNLLYLHLIFNLYQ